MLYDEYEELNFDDFYDQTIYFYKDEFCENCWSTNIPEKEVDTGILINKEKESLYKNYSFKKINCSNSNYIFVSFNINDIKESPLYVKFYSLTKQKTEKKYRFINGLRIDGRLNVYHKDFLPDIIFESDVDSVLIQNNNTQFECSVINNYLSLSKNKTIKNELRNGNIVIKPNNPDIKNIVFSVEERQEFNMSNVEIPKGWNLKTLAPSKDSNELSLYGLGIIGNKDFKENETDTSEKQFVPLETPYVNCSFTNNLYITQYEPILSKIKETLKMNCKLGKNQTLNSIIESSSKGLHGGVLSFNQYLTYYRLIKQAIIDLYFDEKQLFTIFYAENKESNTPTFKPYIKMVTYQKGIYSRQNNQYFISTTINGKRLSNFSSFTIDTDCISKSLCNLTANVNFDYKVNDIIENNSDYAYDYLEYLEFVNQLKNVIIKNSGGYKYSVELKDCPLSPINTKSRQFDFSRCKAINNPDVNKHVQNNNELRFYQKCLYTYIKIKGYVGWKEIKGIYQQLSETLAEKDINLFDLFFPLYYTGLIDVCWNNNRTVYCLPRVALKTSNPIIGTLKPNKNFPDYKSFPQDYNEIKANDKKLALQILKEIPPLEEIIKQNWTRINAITNDFLDSLKYEWYFGSHDGIDKPRPRFIKKSDSIGIRYTAIDRVSLARKPVFFKFSDSEIYLMPNRTENPNAERIAKAVMRAHFNDSEKRIVYDKKGKQLTCFLSDIPVPILRALFIFDNVKLANEHLYENKKEYNEITFNINDEIFSELKRIFSEFMIEEK